jgi:hypothetical protein
MHLNRLANSIPYSNMNRQHCRRRQLIQSVLPLFLPVLSNDSNTQHARVLAICQFYPVHNKDYLIQRIEYNQRQVLCRQ